MIYGFDTWASTKKEESESESEEKRLDVNEMRMLRWMCYMERQDKNRVQTMSSRSGDYNMQSDRNTIEVVWACYTTSTKHACRWIMYIWKHLKEKEEENRRQGRWML